MNGTGSPSRTVSRLPAIELLLVALGGAVGSFARYGSSLVIPGPGGTLLVNVVGAFLLGLLVESVLRLTAATPGNAGRAAALKRWRLLLGTGVLGGFTTYSLFAVDLAESLVAGEIWAALWYGLATVIGGGVASALGILAARVLVRTSSAATGAGTGRGARGTGSGSGSGSGSVPAAGSGAGASASSEGAAQ